MSDHIVSLKVYFAIFISLMVLTVLTVWVAFIDMGLLNTVVALGIAFFKASLVILYFMHVRYSSNLVKIYAAAGFFWLVIMLVFTFSDYLTRSWMEVPKGW